MCRKDGRKSRFWKVVGGVFSAAMFVTLVAWLVYEGNYVGAAGWAFTGLYIVLLSIEQRFFDDLYKAHKEAMELVKEKIKSIEGMREIALDDMNHVDLDHVLKVGRAFQNQDTWRGAQYDTAKLLCDTIVMLRSQVGKGNRNCDVYDTVESALAACHKDREYCKSPIDERKSTVQFMLQDANDNSWNKSDSETKDV